MTISPDSSSSADRSALILYATETGTAQDIALSLRPLLSAHQFSPVEIIGCDDLPSLAYLHHYSLCIFVVATSGQGDLPNNARKFWRMMLRKRLMAGQELRGVRFASVGLGDRAYLKFNWAARKVRKRLLQLGADEVLDGCEADEGAEEGVEGEVNEWLKGLERKLNEYWPISNELEADAGVVDSGPRWRLCKAEGSDQQQIIQANDSTSRDSVNGATEPIHQPRPQLEDEFPATLSLNDRLTLSDHWQDVRLLRFHTSLDIDYLPGDALCLVPENDPSDVNTFLDLMKWTSVADVPIILKQIATSTPINSTRRYPSLEKSPLPHLTPTSTTTLRSLLLTTLDIRAIPRRSFFRTLARYCTHDTFQRDRLLEFTDPQYLDEYFDYATRPRRSILEILQEFESGLEVPWEDVLEVLPVLRGRLFSIASAKHHANQVPQRNGNAAGTTFELLVAIVKYRTVIRKIRRGVCTHWLEGLPVGTKLNIALRTEGRFFKNRAALLQPSGRKHVLVGAGTGLAPLRSLVWEKEGLGLHRHNRRQHNSVNGSSEASNDDNDNESATPQSETLLIFGARNADKDFFFRDEWSTLVAQPSQRHQQQRPVSFHLSTAFSRDQTPKVYVQDKIREPAHAAQIARLILRENATFVVCGSSGNMPKAVRQALIDVLGSSEGGGLGSVEEAERYVEGMQREGRWVQETWS